MNQKTFKDRKLRCLGTPRRNKKLVVMDLDYTLCDIDPDPEGHVVLRPHAENFLTEINKKYDIIIWSATPLDAVKYKLELLNLLPNKKFKILGYVGFKAMVKAKTGGDPELYTKDLRAIWNAFPKYNASNTVLVDDTKSNFLHQMNCGLLVKPFTVENTDASDDAELLLVLKYLLAITSQHKSFLSINHRNWRKYVK